MSAIDYGPLRTVLLILPKKKQIYPLSTSAFKQAQNSIKALNSEYKNALILDVDGTLREINKIVILGVVGFSSFGNILLRISDLFRINIELTLNIQVELSDPECYLFQDLKHQILQCLDSQSKESIEEVFPGQKNLIQSIRESETVNDLISLLLTCDPDDALDIL